MASPIQTAAEELGVTPGTLKRWIYDGAPVVRRGSKGRGKRTLVNVDAIQAWRRSQTAEDALLVIAEEMPELLADAVDEALKLSEGPHKRHLAGALAGTWYLVTVAVLDRLREEAPDVPELVAEPEKIARLRAIFEGSCTLSASSIPGDNDA